ncbi:hypothetical protein [Methanimicrococcus hongohii]|uniref:hypothetical protein n=1 Tax=Methanimicrococcus hongohii TaxID=3028295 RepID=UPI00292D6255|nr:hypothetical protein [Methanimicrococcus sp. Hf6]
MLLQLESGAGLQLESDFGLRLEGGVCLQREGGVCLQWREVFVYAWRAVFMKKSRSDFFSPSLRLPPRASCIIFTIFLQITSRFFHKNLKLTITFIHASQHNSKAP